MLKMTEAEMERIRAFYKDNPPNDIFIAKAKNLLTKMRKLAFDAREVNSPEAHALIDESVERMAFNLRAAEEAREA